MYLNIKTGEITETKQDKKLFGAKEINEIIKTPVADFLASIEFSSIDNAYKSGFRYFFSHENTDIYEITLENGKLLYAICHPRTHSSWTQKV